MLRRKDLDKELMRTVGHFKLEEVFDLVLPEFPDVSWQNVLSRLVKGKAYLTVGTVKRELLKQSKILDNNEIEDKLFNLKIIDIAHHSKRRNWTSYKLLGDNEREGQPYGSFKRKLVHACRLQGIECIVREKTHDEILWLMIVVKKIRPKVWYQTPLFCAYFIGDCYLFFNSRSISPAMLQAFVRCFEFDDIENCFLDGHHITSLYHLLKNKESEAFDGMSVQQDAPEYKPENGRVTRGGIKFTQGEDRKKYADLCLGEDHPKLETFSVMSRNCLWKGTSFVSDMAGEKLDCKITLKSKNIPEMIKNMTKMDVLSPPFPSVIQRLPVLGRNKITIREQR